MKKNDGAIKNTKTSKKDIIGRLSGNSDESFRAKPNPYLPPDTTPPSPPSPTLPVPTPEPSPPGYVRPEKPSPGTFIPSNPGQSGPDLSLPPSGDSSPTQPKKPPAPSEPPSDPAPPAKDDEGD